MLKRILLLALFCSCTIVFIAPATRTSAQDLPASDPFPQVEACTANVEFWKNVYGVWSQGQVAVHDMERLGIVYEVVSLPGPLGDRYTPQQQEFVEDLRERWEKRLKDLERKVERRLELDDEEKALALQITTLAGSNAIQDADKRVRTQRGTRERFRRGIEISSRYDKEFRRIFREAGLPEDLAYLPHVESAFQAAARSSAGAVGIWQFTRSTGKRFLSINSAIDERLDPVAAAHGTAAYLVGAYAKLGDWPIALTSYNHGVGGMAKAVKRYGLDYERIFLEYSGRYFGFASRNFYSEFLAAREVVMQQESYFPEGLTAEPELDLGQITLDAGTTPANIARAYGLPLNELAELNPAWSERAVRSGLSLPPGTTVWIPSAILESLVASGGLPVINPGGIDGDTIYFVRPGDSLSEIARTFGIRVGELRELNGIPSSSSLIRVGQKLNVGSVGGYSTYVVRRGDTLSGIARTYGMKMSSLRELNGLARGESRIRIGQKLRVSGAAGEKIHVVKRGDSLSRIASFYRVHLSDLLRLNQLTMHSLIHPGQTLTIPSN